MKAVSGRYNTLNPFGASRKRSASATLNLHLPAHEPPRNSISDSVLPYGRPPPFKRKKSRLYFQKPIPRPSQALLWRRRIVVGAITCTLILVLLLLVRFKRSPSQVQSEGPSRQEDEAGEELIAPLQEPEFYPWLQFPQLHGFFNGVKTLVPWDRWVPERQQADMLAWAVTHARDMTPTSQEIRPLPLPLERYNPYPDYESKTYLSEYHTVDPCYLDENNTIPAPDIFAYPGVPQHLTLPLFGSHEAIGLRHDVCFERFGRFGPYGYGYDIKEGGVGVGVRSERQGSEEVWQQQSKVDYRGVDWGKAQKTCFEKNQHRFDAPQSSRGTIARLWNGGEKRKVPRNAYVLRTWTGFEYTPHEILTLRAMINELALKSGGEYDVHLLLHVRDESIPIWASNNVYQQVIEENIPEEFWGITTLWSVQLMRTYYPGPFDKVFENPAETDSHGVYRAAHFALQWFAQEHPEYDYVWNWEMDIRQSGHLYEFHTGVVEWAKQQPRRGLWERNAKFWIPAKHGNWSEYTKLVDAETKERGEVPVWGPLSFPNRGMPQRVNDTIPPHGWLEDDFKWGVGEEADLITFNPIFNPSGSGWFFENDITGYSLELPVPPRRCAIVTVARLSRRLLNMMHEETYQSKHSAFPEMWPPTVALHHGLKAVYVPHPVYFDRQWPLDYLDQVFNYPEVAENGPFGGGEHNLLGSSFYYNSVFSGALWRRWLGEVEEHEGGRESERQGTGRMCLRPVLHHPVKAEDSPEEERRAMAEDLLL